MKKQLFSYKFKRKFKNLDLLFFLGPYAVTFFVFTILPVVVSYFIAFTQFNTMEFPVWVGLENYRRLFLEEEYFMLCLQNSFVLASISGPLNYVVAFGFAWVLNEVPPKPRTVLTLLFYLPSMSGGFDVIMNMLLSSDRYGWINAFLIKVGVISDPIQWGQTEEIMLPLAIILLLYGALGAQFLVFLSSLQGVDRSLYEAGAVDGISNRWQELYYITLPSIKGQLMLNAILTITAAVNISAPGIFGSPTYNYKLYTLSMLAADYSGRLEMGYVTAISSIMLIISVTINKIVQYLIGKIGR